jgi:uncharacterized membrane protein
MMFTELRMRSLIMILAGIGLLDALYLSWVKITHSAVYCGTSGACETVNTSRYSEINGIPIAYLGLLAFAAICLLLYLEKHGTFWQENAPLFIFGISLVGVLYSAYLTYLEFWVIQAICPYCVLSAIVMLLLFIVSSVRLWKLLTKTNPTRRGG